MDGDDNLRMYMLHRLRQVKIERYYHLLETIEMEPETNRLLQLIDVVIIQLNHYQLRKYAHILDTSAKLMSEWSLPRRVILVNSRKKTAALQCMATGWTTRAHIERARFIKNDI